MNENNNNEHDEYSHAQSYIDLMDRLEQFENPSRQQNNKMLIDAYGIVYGLAKSLAVMLLLNALDPLSTWIPHVTFLQACAIYFLPKLIVKGEF